MAFFCTPKFRVGERERATECEAACTNLVAKLIDEAVEMGWRREEVAVHLADAADDYVLYLGSNSI